MQSRGFAFVSFFQKSDAESAMQALQGYGYDHLILKLEWAKPSLVSAIRFVTCRCSLRTKGFICLDMIFCDGNCFFCSFCQIMHCVVFSVSPLIFGPLCCETGTPHGMCSEVSVVSVGLLFLWIAYGACGLFTMRVQALLTIRSMTGLFWT